MLFRVGKKRTTVITGVTISYQLLLLLLELLEKKGNTPLDALASKDVFQFCLFRELGQYINRYVSELSTL